MKKRPITSDREEKIKEMKAKLSSEVGMEYNDEIYKGHRGLSNRFQPSNLGGKLIKNMIVTFERTFNK